jgi:hypothetical protein
MGIGPGFQWFAKTKSLQTKNTKIYRFSYNIINWKKTRSFKQGTKKEKSQETFTIKGSNIMMLRKTYVCKKTLNAHKSALVGKI